LGENKEVVNFWLSSGKTKEQLIQGLSAQIRNGNEPQVPVDEETPEDEAYRTLCGNSPDSIARTKPKKWMKLIHKKVMKVTFLIVMNLRLLFLQVQMLWTSRL
jgi:hypothetical protein